VFTGGGDRARWENRMNGDIQTLIGHDEKKIEYLEGGAELAF
jgi:hypothetical protein